MLFLEHSPGFYHTCNLLPKHEVGGMRGFRSVYAFDRPTVSVIREKGSFRDLTNELYVYSDTLFLDFDQGKTGLGRVLAGLRTKGVGYQVYSSGGKGYHVHVDILPMEGADVPEQQKAFVEEMKFAVDTSFLHTTGLFRLPNTVHQTTGNEKELVDARSGGSLVIARREIRAREVVSEDDLFALGLRKILYFLDHGPEPGDRHRELFTLGRVLCKSGLSQETVSDLLQNLNQHWDHPKERAEVERAVRQACNL